MTKAEIMKWLLFVGSEPIEWTEVLRKHPDSGFNPNEWHVTQYKQYKKFANTFAEWVSDGFIEKRTVEVKTSKAKRRAEGLEILILYYLSDKAKAKL